VRYSPAIGSGDEFMARKLDVHILLYSEYDISIAHCLEFDIVAQGKKKIEALKNLLDAIELQISFALENNDLVSIFNPAPAEYWKYNTDFQNERIQAISVYSVHPRSNSIGLFTR